ncbi:DNA-processing protein DprA [Empedobacter brevis]|uniref:DNA-processing protein DprA n=1 Tax=Empedobacter brevis TaxID=247 RepID=UPI0023F2650D|nr:DNA-processing protein DprA [Empedobacter brevis]
MQTDLPYILALSFQKGIGDVTARKIIQFFGSAETAWNCKPKDLMQISGIGWQMSKDFGNKKWLDLALTEIEFCKNNQINVLTFYDQDYPLLLRECIDAPLVIFCKGNLNFNQFNNKKVAIVGTRKMTNYGRIFITELIEGLSDFDVTIVSGLAYGCDVEAHNHAVKKELETWAVMGTNLERIYPASHKKIAMEILNKGGWITEQPSFKSILPEAFLQRNRMIAGLSDITIVVESAFKGGSLVTAKFANEYNREVFALPGKLTDILSIGCNYLIKSHQAYLVENSKDIIDYFNFNSKKKAKQMNLFVDFSEEEKVLVDYLTINGKQHIDKISFDLDLKSYELMPLLLDLELKQIISTLPGKFYDLL